MKEAGIDGVEIVASHGYLPAQFLNPAVNQRDDQYGGSLDNRLRFMREVANNIRAKAGDDFVVGMRLSGDDLSTDGIGLDDMQEICAALAGDGILDYMSVVGGTCSTLAGSVHIVPPMSYDSGYTAPISAAIKSRTDIPVFVTGRIN